jgi:hypothetical protein
MTNAPLVRLVDSSVAVSCQRMSCIPRIQCWREFIADAWCVIDCQPNNSDFPIRAVFDVKSNDQIGQLPKTIDKQVAPNDLQIYGSIGNTPHAYVFRALPYASGNTRLQ